jgi:hypothetical protein
MRALACLCFVLTTAEAAPRFLEPQPAVFPPISERFPYASDLALDGNRLAVATFQNGGNRNVYVYERSPDGTWGTPTLAMTGSGAYHALPVRIALQGNLLAMAFRNQLLIAERTSSGWTRTAAFGPPSGITEMGADVDIDAGTIVVSGESSRAQALIFRKNAAGVWQYTGSVNGESSCPATMKSSSAATWISPATPSSWAALDLHHR